MRTGDVVTDGQGRIFTVGEMLGRGLWGSSWAIRDASGKEWVLKRALAASDFLADVPVPDALIAACRDGLREQADLLRRALLPFLPRLEAELVLPDGAPGIVMPRYPSNLKRAMTAGKPFPDVLRLLLRAAELLDNVDRVHGNLRPSNILINDRGEPVLSDILPKAVAAHRKRLAEHARDREDYLPPDAESETPVWDTWSLCAVLYQAAVQALPAPDARREERFSLPRHGLDKVELATLRDRVLARLRQEDGNPRFAPRLAERLSALLGRGLSFSNEPSPPYRFDSMQVLRPRLEEVCELIDPRVDHAGHVLLAPVARNGVFQGGDPALFSVTIGCSPGVSSHEDVACGLQLRDLDAQGDTRIAVPEARYTVKAHPSGRLRFDFSVPYLSPGRYRANVAFAIKDSRREPLVASGDFDVRPPPGYIPPAPEQTSSGPIPIPLARSRDAAASKREGEGAFGPATDSRDADVVADLFPLPIAPSSSGAEPSSVNTYVEPPVDPPTTPPPPAPEPPRTQATVTESAAQPNVTPMPNPAEVVDDRATHPSTAPPPAWSRPVDWDDIAPAGYNEPYVPGPPGAEDLPSWSKSAPASEKAGSIGAVVNWARELLRRDPYTAFMVGIASALALLVVVFLLFGS